MNNSQPSPTPPRRKKRTTPLLIFAFAAIAAIIGTHLYHQQLSTSSNEAAVSAADSADIRNLEAGEKFLASKSKESGVQSLGAGIFYKELKAGSGSSPTATSTVSVHYEGTLIDGTVFDSSYQRGEPAQFPVSGVVAGWQIALKAMKPGAVWELYLPHYMAYGERGSGNNIPPFSALIFKIELLEIK